MRRYLSPAIWAIIAIFSALLAIGAALLAGSDPTAQAEKQAEKFREALAGCRVAIETATPFDGTGYEPMVVPLHEIAENSIDIAFWRIPDSTLYVDDQTRSGAGGRVSSLCQIRRDGDAADLSVPEQAFIARAFMLERASLVAKGTHEFRDIGDLYPAVSAAFGTVGRNARGCSVIVMMMFTPNGEVFSAFAGEQAEPECVAE